MPYDAKIVARFWSKVRICEHGTACEVCCWEWQAGRTSDGYGNFHIAKVEGVRVREHAHVVALELHRQEFLSLDHCALHHCDNPPCCNYHHLWAGTHQENMEDMWRKGRQKRPRGEDNPAAKLTAARVLELRALAATGDYTRAELARRYAIDDWTVHRAVCGGTWARLPGAITPRWRHRVPPRDTGGKFCS